MMGPTQLYCLWDNSKIQSIHSTCLVNVTCQKDSIGDSKHNLNRHQSLWLQVGSHGVEAAWAGGRNGREVMNRLFPLAPDLLSPGGLFYLVTIKENNPGNTDQFIF